MRVLVVDDDPSVRAMVRVGLDPIEVIEADDEPSTMAALRDSAIDVVLLDLSLPGKDGFAILSDIRSDPESGDPAVLMLTGRVGEEDRVAAFRLGADGYLTKPMDPDDLVKEVESAAGRTPEQRERLRDAERTQAELFHSLEYGFGS